MDLKELNKDELITEFLRITRNYLDAIGQASYFEELTIIKLREDLLAVIEELEKRRDQQNQILN